MQIDNATEKDIEKLQEKVSELTEENPLLESRVYEQEEQPTNAKIFEKLEAIERQLRLIFDEHVLIDGRFVKIPNKP